MVVPNNFFIYWENDASLDRYKNIAMGRQGIIRP